MNIVFQDNAIKIFAFVQLFAMMKKNTMEINEVCVEDGCLSRVI